MYIRKNIFIFLGALTYCLSASFCQASTGGLWGEYNRSDDLECDEDLKCNSEWGRTYELKSLEIESADFDADDLIAKTGRDPYSHQAQVTWIGAIKADEVGDYQFRVDMSGSQQYYVQIDDECAFPLNSSGLCYRYGDMSGTRTLTAGWHEIYIKTTVYAKSMNSKFHLYWITPSGEDWESIPTDNLSYKYWADNTIILPSSGKAKINYVASGVGMAKAIEDGVDPEIEIDMPVDFNKIIKEDVYITWFSRNNIINKNIAVTNEKTGTKENITGTELKTEYGLSASYPGMIANLPKSLINNGGTGNKLKLSFGGLGENGAKENGIGIIVPYRDLNMPQGQIFLNMYSASAYHGVTPTFIFSTEGLDNTDIRPVFFLTDGETKTKSNFRPNYLMMLSGNGSLPEDYTFLKNEPGARIIVPESNPINRDDPNTWYPNYGREGRQLDVISSNYTPNLWSGKDATSPTGNKDGEIDPISISADHTWIAFQYYGTNFDQDGVTGSGESGPIAGGGMFSTMDDSKKYTLEVTVNGKGSINSSPAGINCPGDCSEKYFSGTSVTLTANLELESIFSGWGGDCNGTGTCEIIMNEDKTVMATFATIPPVIGACGSAENFSFCFEPTDNLCAAGSVSAEGVQYNSASERWEWLCEGPGGNSSLCEAGKSCGWKEVAP